MQRRSFLTGLAAIPALAALHGCKTQRQADAAGRRARQAMEWRNEALAAFPYERVQVSGHIALREWERLKAAGRGTPVVIGDDEDLDMILVPFHPSYWANKKEPVLADTLARADALTHPDDLLAYHRQEEEEMRATLENMCREDTELCRAIAGFDAFTGRSGGDPRQAKTPYEPPVGEWPERLPPAVTGLTVAEDILTGRLLDPVTIVLVPADDPTTIPAHLRWGGWNANPPSEYHVAALRSWRDRYGADLVGLSFDTMNIRVARRPPSQDEAMALAREQYVYCNDIVDQGAGTLSRLAALLISQDWWYFWWD